MRHGTSRPRGGVRCQQPEPVDVHPVPRGQQQMVGPQGLRTSAGVHDPDLKTHPAVLGPRGADRAAAQHRDPVVDAVFQPPAAGRTEHVVQQPQPQPLRQKANRAPAVAARQQRPARSERGTRLEDPYRTRPVAGTVGVGRTAEGDGRRAGDHRGKGPGLVQQRGALQGRLPGAEDSDPLSREPARITVPAGVGDQLRREEPGQFRGLVGERNQSGGHHHVLGEELFPGVQGDAEQPVDRHDGTDPAALQFRHTTLLEPPPVGDHLLDGDGVPVADGAASPRGAEVLQTVSGLRRGEGGSGGDGLQIHAFGHVGVPALHGFTEHPPRCPRRAQPGGRGEPVGARPDDDRGQPLRSVMDAPAPGASVPGAEPDVHGHARSLVSRVRRGRHGRAPAQRAHSSSTGATVWVSHP